MWGTSHPVTINLYAKHTSTEYRVPEDVGSSKDQIWSFCSQKVSKEELVILTKVKFCEGSQAVTGEVAKGKIVQCTFATLADSKKDYDSYIVCKNFYIRNKKLYVGLEERSLFAEWKTSVHLLCTSFFKILSKGISGGPVQVRLRAIVCMFVVPTVALMGLLMPFASYYFNCIIGDLDCWMHHFSNKDINVMTPVTRSRMSSNGCFATMLQPYAYVNEDLWGDNNVYISPESRDGGGCASRIADYLRTKYHDGSLVLVRDRTGYNCEWHNLFLSLWW